MRRVALFSVLSAAGIFAQNPVITFENGKVITLAFADGREAQVYLIKRKPELYEIPFKITDNFCADGTEILCHFSGAFGKAEISLRWTKHIDSSRVGQEVILWPKANPDQTQILYGMDYLGFTD